MSTVTGLVLAAGASTRMGRPKQLLPAGGRPLLHRVLEQALQSHLDSVFLILGFMAEEIKESLGPLHAHPKLRIFENRRYTEGISSSIITGLAGVGSSCDHVMIILGDMPFITAPLINLLLDHYLASGLPLGAVGGEKRRGHPVIIHRRFFHELRGLKGDVGARDLFSRYREQVCLVEPVENYSDMDIDTAEDYSAFIASLKGKTP